MPLSQRPAVSLVAGLRSAADGPFGVSQGLIRSGEVPDESNEGSGMLDIVRLFENPLKLFEFPIGKADDLPWLHRGHPVNTEVSLFPTDQEPSYALRVQSLLRPAEGFSERFKGNILHL